MPCSDRPYSQILDCIGLPASFHCMLEVLDEPGSLYCVARGFIANCSSIKRSIGDNTLNCPDVGWVKSGQVSHEVFNRSVKLWISLILQRGVADERSERKVFTSPAFEQPNCCARKGNLNILHRGNLKDSKDSREALGLNPVTTEECFGNPDLHHVDVLRRHYGIQGNIGKLREAVRAIIETAVSLTVRRSWTAASLALRNTFANPPRTGFVSHLRRPPHST